MDKYRWLKVILLLLPAALLSIVVFMNTQAAQNAAPAAVGGVLDLTGWDAQERSCFQMRGEWQVFPDKLLNAEEIKSNREKSLLFSLPYHYQKSDLYGHGLRDYDTATYRLQVINAPSGSDLAIQVRDLTAAYRLYIDDQLIAANGEMTDSEWAPISDYRFHTVHFNPEKSSFNIVLQIANLYDDRGLLQWPLAFGTDEALERSGYILSLVAYLSAGALLTIFIILVLFWLFLREKALMILCILGMCTFLQVISIHQILANIIPGMSLMVLDQINYSASYGIQYLIPASISAIYPGLFPRWFMRSLLPYSLVLVLCVWVFPYTIIDIGLVFDMVMMLIFIATILLLVIAALEKRPGSAAMLVFMSCVVPFVLNGLAADDVFFAYYVVAGSGMLYIIIILVQCAILARRYKQAQYLEMSALKEQIRPHFVHNALATIISISRHDPDRSRELLMDFSDYLRGRFDFTGVDFISIEQELELVRAYVALEQARFGDRFRVQYELDAHRFLIPPLILQPLVENALVHGLRGKEGGGTVLVYTRRRNKMVRIGVKDDGSGLQCQSDQDQVRPGIGIANINRRLEKIYGIQLNYRFPSEGGCVVYLEIPYKEARGYENHAG